MSYEFFSVRTVTGRKRHRCQHCNRQIDTGELHYYAAGKWEGEFTDYREHVECRDAWNALYFDRKDYDAFEPAPFLSGAEDIDDDDLVWLRETHPLVAERMGWLTPSDATEDA